MPLFCPPASASCATECYQVGLDTRSLYVTQQQDGFLPPPRSDASIDDGTEAKYFRIQAKGPRVVLTPKGVEPIRLVTIGHNRFVRRDVVQLF